MLRYSSTSPSCAAGPPFLAPNRIARRALLSAGTFLAILIALLVAYQAWAHHEHHAAPYRV
ncbi:Hypothetical protein A7982_03309 [Minicystis rosea]|nr:Hypothetical protein A7982_03309 [Minicystis rosea]